MAEVDSRLFGRRVLVIGASSGIGRATADALVKEGARVGYAARRLDRLEEAARAAGNEAFAVECDVCDEASIQAAVATAVAALGGLDALVYTPGIATFQPLAEIDADCWHRVLATNLIGPSLALRASIAHLEESRGKAVIVSSIVIDDRPPRAGNAPYVVSKTGLETLVQAWQGEHRAVGFTAIAMADTLTEFGQNEALAQLDRMQELVQDWVQDGYMYGRTMDPESVAEQIVSALKSRETVRRVAITPHYSADPNGVSEIWSE